MKIVSSIVLLAFLSLSFSSYSLAQAHRGQLDTDGILSPGEIRNPRIDYRGQGYGHYRNHDRYPDYGRYDRERWDRYHDDYRGRYDYRYRDDFHGSRFEHALLDGVRSGRISRREEDELRRLTDDLRYRARDYRRDGRLSEWERDDLEDRESYFRKKLDHELHDGERR